MPPKATPCRRPSPLAAPKSRPRSARDHSHRRAATSTVSSASPPPVVQSAQVPPTLIDQLLDSARPFSAEVPRTPFLSEQFAEGETFWRSVFAIPAEPQDWPRSDWSASTFGVPSYNSDYQLGQQVTWACKHGSVAVISAINSGDWAPVTLRTVYLMMCDKVLQLGLHARQVHCTTNNLVTYLQWQGERDADIDKAYRWAISHLPQHVTHDLSRSQLSTLCYGALHANYVHPYDAQTPLTPEQYVHFDRSYLAEYAPQPSDAAKYGYMVLQGSIDIGDPDIENKITQEMRAFEVARQEQGMPEFQYTGPLHLHGLPPASPPQPDRSAIPSGLTLVMSEDDG